MPVSLCADFDASQLRSFARKSKDGPQARRLLAVVATRNGNCLLGVNLVDSVTSAIYACTRRSNSSPGAAALEQHHDRCAPASARSSPEGAQPADISA